MPRNFMTLAEVAAEMHVCSATVTRWLKKGKGPAFYRTLDNSYRFPVDEFRRWYDSHTAV